MLPVLFTKSLAAASANNIANSQSVSAVVASVSINGSAAAGGVATLDSQRRVIITSAGNDSALTFTVYGTNDAGIAIQDSFLGTNGGVAVSNRDFRTVTAIRTSGATAGGITVGTNATGSSQWFMPNYHLTPFILDVESAVTGTVTYSIETTMDDYWTPPTGQAQVRGWTGIVLVRPTTVVAATAGSSLVITAPCRGWRATVTAGAGSVTCQGLQAGISNY